jgi:nicotinic acid mononucleotide adenylyltransferase
MSWDIGKKYSLFIGRWQPPHKGHEFLIRKKLSEGSPVAIGVRDIPADEKNPFTTNQTVEMLQKLYEDEDVVVVPIPDISGVHYGRGVGYEIVEHQPPEDIKRISATEIRNSIKDGNDSWRELVDPGIQDLVIKFLKENEQ